VRKEFPQSNSLHPVVRSSILLLSLLCLTVISRLTTGKLLPTDQYEVLLFQSSVLLVVLATLVSERYFTGPSDAFLNSLSALLTILPLRSLAPRAVWWGLSLFLIGVFELSLFVLLFQAKSSERTRNARLSRAIAYAYGVCTKIGRAKVIFTVVFLVSLTFFGDARNQSGTALTFFLGLYLLVWQIGIPMFLSDRLRMRRPSSVELVGEVVRFDSPDLARVRLFEGNRWNGNDDPVILRLPDGQRCYGVPLMSEYRVDGVMGTVLLARSVSLRGGNSSYSRQQLLDAMFPQQGSQILGLVREDTSSSQLRFELLPHASVSLYQLVCVIVSQERVFFQIVDGKTSEEAFGTLIYGSQIVTTNPLGTLAAAGRFERVKWLPAINSPVLSTNELTISTAPSEEFVLGKVVDTNIDLRGDFIANLETHTAIFGTTGSGKTEFAFELIRHAAARGVKIICIDLTGQYVSRLSDLNPISLTLAEGKADDLSNKLFDAETGAYGAGAEKRVLAEFRSTLQEDVETKLRDFLSSGGSNLALVELREMSNTKATLMLTEMYLSTLLKLARERIYSGKILVVVEEAHTVMPEHNFSGLGDYDTRGTISKIAQIALQGRKYGVGLLVIAQRTATVSKSVLTQCNTFISFTCVDDTSIGFLRNVYGSSVAESLPRLRKLQAVASGQWIDSELPITFSVPFDDKKSKFHPF